MSIKGRLGLIQGMLNMVTVGLVLYNTMLYDVLSYLHCIIVYYNILYMPSCYMAYLAHVVETAPTLAVAGFVAGSWIPAAELGPGGGLWPVQARLQRLRHRSVPVRIRGLV